MNKYKYHRVANLDVTLFLDR